MWYINNFSVAVLNLLLIPKKTFIEMKYVKHLNTVAKVNTFWKGGWGNWSKEQIIVQYLLFSEYL